MDMNTDTAFFLPLNDLFCFVKQLGGEILCYCNLNINHWSFVSCVFRA